MRGQRERERERERDGETEKQRDRETERRRDRDGETERRGHRETGTQRDRETERQKERPRTSLRALYRHIILFVEGGGARGVCSFSLCLGLCCEERGGRSGCLLQRPHPAQRAAPRSREMERARDRDREKREREGERGWGSASPDGIATLPLQSAVGSSPLSSVCRCGCSAHLMPLCAAAVCVRGLSDSSATASACVCRAPAPPTPTRSAVASGACLTRLAPGLQKLSNSIDSAIQYRMPIQTGRQSKSQMASLRALRLAADSDAR